MKVIRHYKKTVSEADEIQTGNGNGTSDGLKSPNQNPQNAQKVTAINGQIAELLNQRLQKKTQYQQDIKAIEDKIVQLQKQLADLGENVDASVIEESFKTPKFRKKLYESVTNRTDEMYVSLKLAFDTVEDLSYTPEDSKLKRFAKTIIGYINRSDFKDNENKSESFDDYVMTMVNNSHMSLTKKELKSFIENLNNVLRENVMFSWIFA